MHVQQVRRPVRSKKRSAYTLKVYLLHEHNELIGRAASKRGIVISYLSSVTISLSSIRPAQVVRTVASDRPV